MGAIMTIECIKKTQAIHTPELSWDANGNAIEFGEPFPVMLWKFKDENGNLWNTETAIDGTEEEAASIILGNTK
jgi:hypothetical protein